MGIRTNHIKFQSEVLIILLCPGTYTCATHVYVGFLTIQGLRLAFQLASPVASGRFDSLARYSYLGATKVLSDSQGRVELLVGLAFSYHSLHDRQAPSVPLF